MNKMPWRIYQHAAIPTTDPHEVVDKSMVETGEIWQKGVLMCKWTSDFDCQRQTDWWYVIKDEPFDINVIKSKRRYEVKKGCSNYNVHIIEHPEKYVHDLYLVTSDAYQGYPAKYRPSVSLESMKRIVETWGEYTIFGAFSKSTQELEGYAIICEHKKCIHFYSLRVKRESEKKAINAAIVNGILEHYATQLSNGGYLCDGNRSVNHETKFQDYLEKYFMFRKAYCTLHLEYRKGFGILVNCLYPFRKLLKGLDGIKLIHYCNSILTLETIKRNSL